MKKIYLYLLLFVCSFGYCQFSISTVNVTTCENTSQNFGFNLTQNVVVEANLEDYTMGYFESEANAIANINEIPNPTFYPIFTTQSFYVRVVNIQTNEIQFASFSILVLANPIANPAVLTFCDQNVPPIYNLEDANAQILGNQQNVTIAYYDNPFSGGTIITGSPFIQTVFPIQVIGVEIDNGTCTSTRTSITLSTNDCNPCPKPTAITVPAASITAYSAVVAWTSPNTSNNEIILFPAGSPPPTADNPGWISSISGNQYAMTGLLPGYCYDVYVRSRCNSESVSDWTGPRTFCTYGCVDAGNCPGNLDLRAFKDSNANGIKEDDEPDFINGAFEYEINNSGNPITSYSNTGSFRIFDTNTTNSYHLSFNVNSELTPYYNATVVFDNIHVQANTSQIFYFPVTSIASYLDVEAKLIPYINPRPGFIYTNIIKYKNNGTDNIASGTIDFTKNSAVTINNISQSGTTNTPNGFSYDFINLAPNEERQFEVAMLVPTIPNVNLGQVLTNSVTITPLVDDAFPANNNASMSQIVVGSYDPNDKTEAHGGKIAMDVFTENDFLTYTIQFENTGTANAEFIRVEDLLDPSLNPESVAMHDASHPYNMRRIGNKLIWNFYDVNLPPTSTNPTQSHGFIQFKIKPTAGYVTGTMIPNAADIYFDYNPAIVTDTFQTEFVETLASASFDANGFYMYPNPAKTLVNIGLNDTTESIANVNVYDVLGKSVRAIADIDATQINFDVSALTKGIYFVEITTMNQLKIIKKLVIQ